MHFKDPERQRSFEKKGYVILDLLEDKDISRLQAIYDSYPPRQVANFQVSNYEKDPVKNRRIDAAIREVIEGPIARHLSHYQLLCGFFYIKFPGPDSAFYIHKDWNIVDESKHTSLHIWIPLTDTNAQNGNLFFCPFDYRKQLTYRGSPGFEYPEPGWLTRLANRFYRTDIYTNKGQALCFDHKLTHGSRPNNTSGTRVAAGISLIPDDAQMVHYHRDNNGKIAKLDVNNDFYLDFDLSSVGSS